MIVTLQLLVLRDAPLFSENAQKQTPCDCAEKSGNNNIALYLESKMVFSVSLFTITQKARKMITDIKCKDTIRAAHSQPFLL